MAYNTKSIKQTNIYANRSISSPDVRSFYCQPSSVASFHGSAMLVVMIRCRISYYKEQLDGWRHRGRPHESWRDDIKEWTGQSMSSLLRIHTTEADGQSLRRMQVSYVVRQRRLGVGGCILLVSLSSCSLTDRDQNPNISHKTVRDYLVVNFEIPKSVSFREK